MNDDIEITIFTPTYNRGYILPKLYESLCNQSNRNFKWLIIDDGSTDSTRTIVNNWIEEHLINIKYIYQENKGKPYAHNIGVHECDTKLFACVDSDDILIDDAISNILECDISDKDCIGIVFKRGYDLEKSITTWNYNLKKATLFEAEKDYSLRGDTFLVFKSEYIKKYYFPIFNNEKFIPESYLYDLLSLEGYLLFDNRILYLCKYLSDGYTYNMRKINANNPKGYRTYILNRLKMDINLKDKVTDTIRYVAIQFIIDKKDIFKFTVYPFLTFISYFPGLYFYRKCYSSFTQKKQK